MAVQVSYPGVYIEEFAPAPPIQGVGTSTAAFIGPARSGDLGIPTKLASFDTFKALFGAQPLPGFFMWYAVRGFYENGGQICYVVRASNGKYASLTLKTAATPTCSGAGARSRRPGDTAAGGGRGRPRAAEQQHQPVSADQHVRRDGHPRGPAAQRGGSGAVPARRLGVARRGRPTGTRYSPSAATGCG